MKRRPALELFAAMVGRPRDEVLQERERQLRAAVRVIIRRRWAGRATTWRSPASRGPPLGKGFEDDARRLRPIPARATRGCHWRPRGTPCLAVRHIWTRASSFRSTPNRERRLGVPVRSRPRRGHYPSLRVIQTTSCTAGKTDRVRGAARATNEPGRTPRPGQR